MSFAASSSTDAARRWRHSAHTAVCDTIEPWEHGTVVRAARYPTYYDFNTVRVEEEPDMDAAELAAFADRALAGLGHRKLEFEEVEAGERRRRELTSAGWRAMRLVWMRHERPLPPEGGRPPIEPVPYGGVDALRDAWHREDFAGMEYERYRHAAREVAEARGAVVLAAVEAGAPVGFAQLERDGAGAEVTQVFVRGDRRGRGIGTALTRAAVLAALDSGAGEVWIVADDEDRPKELYARLGFEPAWRMLEFLLVL